MFCQGFEDSERVLGYFFVPGLFFILFFSILLIYGSFGVGVMGLVFWIGLLALGFSVDGGWSLWCGAFWGYVRGLGHSI